MAGVAEGEKLLTVAKAWLSTEPRLASSNAVIPNGLARSKVFSSQPFHVTRAVYTTDTELAAWGDDKIFQVGGEQLTQTEESVWLVLVREALSQAINPSTQNKVLVEFKEADMLRTLGLPVTSQYRASLRTALHHLGRAQFKMEFGEDDNKYEGSLLDNDPRTRAGSTSCRVWLDIKLSAIFLAGWSYLNFEHRLALRKHPLAQWLLTHYSTHKKPIPVGNARLKELAGRAKMREDKWLAALGIALGQLSETTGWKCTLDAKGQVRVSKKDEHLAEPVKLDPESLDGCLFEAWLATLSMEQLEKEVKKLGYPLSRLNLANPLEMRNGLRQLLLCRPSLLERQLVRLRRAEEDI